MRKGFTRFLNSTALVTVPARYPSVEQNRPRVSNGIVIENCTISNGRSGIVLINRHHAPKLSDDVVQLFAVDQPEYITRHIEERFLPDARKGYFQLGTLTNYRAKEGAVASRLGDHQESRIQEQFNTRSGFFERASLRGIEVTNTSITGTNRQIVVETIVNDFCSCSSLGKFSLERGEAIRNLETDLEKRPGAYVTYHMPTLKLALEEYSSQSQTLSEFIFLGRNVEYGEKDRTWDVERNFSYQHDRDALAIWLGISFVKSPSFTHEEEYRLLLVDPSAPGGLGDHTENIIIQENSSIAASIFISDTY